MRVHWTDTTQAHLDAIYVYIAQDSAEYAIRTMEDFGEAKARQPPREQEVGL
jgi:plasmid stabilization system protein ParE